MSCAPATVGPEDFESDFRLAQGGAESGRGRARRNRLGIAGEVEIVGAANIAEGVHQHDAVKPGAILGGALDFGLILLIDFRADQRSGFFQLLNAFFERG